MNIQGFRTIGEFEKQDSVLMAWPNVEFACKGYNVDTMILEIVRNLYGNVHIIICCDSGEVRQRAINKIKTCGMDIEKIQFIIYPTPIPYPRDFGAEVLVNKCGERLLRGSIRIMRIYNVKTKNLVSIEYTLLIYNCT
ncbi:hypothetical protein PDN14_22230 [Bacillus cereus group sp. Bc222]|uniref:hypothetical protein n=1 Tax=Bacillus cereus group sp. Bc222 TaxID=3018111 RepID=UPI0022E4BCC1|nr:hypothetical protein [Bacillus cereus group sp. Bc222]MDA2241156.1 hypothetical protein [Bacillus cereus group sp. Bc222]